MVYLYHQYEPLKLKILAVVRCIGTLFFKRKPNILRELNFHSFKNSFLSIFMHSENSLTPAKTQFANQKENLFSCPGLGITNAHFCSHCLNVSLVFWMRNCPSFTLWNAANLHFRVEELVHLSTTFFSGRKRPIISASRKRGVRL